MNIPDKWKNELNSLSQKDYITLTKAILFDLPEPQISENNQYIADRIYEGLRKTEYNRIAKQKAKQKCLNSNGNQIEFKRISNGFQTEFKLNSSKEERKEGVPPCSPLPLSPTPPITNPPIIPPCQEKREEVTDSAGAGACEDEQIPFEGFEPLDPPESEVKHRKPTIAERFEALWAEYPKKNGKKNAFESYQRALKDGVTDEVIADGIRRYKEHIATKHTEDKYILIGSSYFQQRRWEDEYDTNTADGKDENGKPAWMSQEDWEEMNAVFG
jgi:hypothetical protein